jgi:serpin B
MGSGTDQETVPDKVSSVTENVRQDVAESNGSAPQHDFRTVQSELERQDGDGVAQADIDACVDGINQFAFDLLMRFETTSKNVMFSPYSIAVALAMTYAGAEGRTEEQM